MKIATNSTYQTELEKAIDSVCGDEFEYSLSDWIDPITGLDSVLVDLPEDTDLFELQQEFVFHLTDCLIKELDEWRIDRVSDIIVLWP